MTSPLFTYQLIVAYDGTSFGGWQVQPNAITVQQLLQEAASTILRSPTYVTGAGRTDAGVHALAQSAHLISDKPLTIEKFKMSLNGILPPEIRVKGIILVANDFHARYSAKAKIYRYYLNLGPLANPFTRHYSWHISAPFDTAKAAEAAQKFVGTHDFCSFANENGKEGEKDTIRTIFRIDMYPTEDGVYFEFEGNGFLYKMVRNLTGFIAEVGMRKCSADRIPDILAAKNRKAATSRVAPAKGLFLVRVIY